PRLISHVPGGLHAPHKQKRVGTSGRLRADARHDLLRLVDVALAERVIGEGEGFIRVATALAPHGSSKAQQ
ncbi:MAG TPA: hypothetical protein VNH83_02150, partial [Bryobacteraceae bacterium]|nr:hypothetical protein [Bryobacteraceae bacterium]